jgi:DNA-binding transcriptional ArsR family regulator/uncharacterized protein YndB with AHSA1/START domain
MRSTTGRAASESATSDALQAILDALASPIRREILWMVWDTELAAGTIADAFDVTPATISSHLLVLRSAGLVTMRSDGNFRRYRADRPAMEAALPLLASADGKWEVADALPEQALAAASIELWVTVTADVKRIDRAEIFDRFVDGRRFEEWLGVPVRIADGRFAAELEWGTKVRGHYAIVAPPHLIAVRWDFDDDAVPVPGRQLVGYVRFFDRRGGCRVEVHQRAADAEQARFLSAAWSMVLGRLRQHAEAEHPSSGTRRRPRPKRSPGT